jgi:hypothetical protein
MKQHKIFPGVILIGFGLYFYFQQTNIVLFREFYTWPTLFIIIGVAFLIQGYAGRDYESILPGTILVGLGIHFHVVNRLPVWPDHIGIFILVIALGYLLRYQKTGTGFSYGILFITLSIMLLFYDKLSNWLNFMEDPVRTAWEYWPFLLVLIGLFIIFFKRK